MYVRLYEFPEALNFDKCPKYSWVRRCFFFQSWPISDEKAYLPLAMCASTRCHVFFKWSPQLECLQFFFIPYSCFLEFAKLDFK